jgi:hypothetical protein
MSDYTPIKALVIISRDLDKASTRFRFAQYEPLLRQRGVLLDYVRRDAIDAGVLERLPDYDVLINQKCLLRRALAKKIIARSRRIVFDLDDAIWTRSGRRHSWWTAFRVKSRLVQWLREADVVTAANEYLADYARQYSSRVKVVHMALDLEQWQPRQTDRGHEKTVTIGWAGSPATLKNLEHIAPCLCELLAIHRECRLAVYSGKRPRINCDFDYTPFASGTEAEFVRNLDIGLLPLPEDDAFTRGKSPIKVLQYLACAVPVVGQIRVATGEILNTTNSITVERDDDWRIAIETLLSDPARRKQLGQAGRNFVIREHAMAHTVEQITAALRGTKEE